MARHDLYLEGGWKNSIVLSKQLGETNVEDYVELKGLRDYHRDPVLHTLLGTRYIKRARGLNGL